MADFSLLPPKIRSTRISHAQLINDKVDGPVIDIGCSVGRTSYELANFFNEPVPGIDLNFAMLKTAAMISEHGRITYCKRREGMVYERKSFPVTFENSSMVDYWVCDAASMPFPGNTFSLAVSLNVLDCLWSPYNHLEELSRILAPHAKAIIATPFYW